MPRDSLLYVLLARATSCEEDGHCAVISILFLFFLPFIAVVSSLAVSLSAPVVVVGGVGTPRRRSYFNPFVPPLPSSGKASKAPRSGRLGCWPRRCSCTHTHTHTHTHARRPEVPDRPRPSPPFSPPCLAWRCIAFSVRRRLPLCRSAATNHRLSPPGRW